MKTQKDIEIRMASCYRLAEEFMKDYLESGEESLLRCHNTFQDKANALSWVLTEVKK